MRSKMTALAIAGALAGTAMLAATTGASAQFWYGYGAPWYGYTAGYGYGYGPGYVYGPALGGVYAYNDVPAGDTGYCARRYRSYDPATGTYLGYDGIRHAC